ncbi:MAG: KEOPS complex N(6)-L-threonylcarbamoyladenine synthase Kae1 [Candidatus Pacearchaeota archaeon]
MSIILGIESTAHTFGVGAVKHGEVIANAKRTFTTESEGLVPMEVAEHHFNNKHEVYFEAIDEAGIKEEEIDAVAFSQGPGLPPCLKEGLDFAKEVASKLEKPIVPVNHCIAHLEIGRLYGVKDPVMLYTSGANTQIIAYASGKYRVFGETIDIGIGNFIDSFARDAGLGFPGGPKLEKLAKEAENFIELPYSIKGMDTAFSGLSTNLKQKLNSGEYNLSDLAYSMQEHVFAMVIESAERAMAHTGKKELLLAGGVGCNARLQEMCKKMCADRAAEFFCPAKSLLVDNGAMMAYLGEIKFNSDIHVPVEEIDSVDISPKQRTDDVKVEWK